MAKPIELFKSDRQFQEYAKWWQHKLFLDSWFIVFHLASEDIVDETGERVVSGLCEYDFTNKEASITICNTTENDEGSVLRNISELNLIHELLHLKNEYILAVENPEDRSFHKYIAHQGLEEMAKTLLRVKYNLDCNYFLGSGK